jgi:hypothetical protein
MGVSVLPTIHNPFFLFTHPSMSYGLVMKKPSTKPAR